MSDVPPSKSPDLTAFIDISTEKDGRPVLRLPPEGGKAMLGRAPSNDIVFADSRISWHHALLWTEGGGIWLRDLGSTNHTYLNNESVKQPAMLPGHGHINLARAVDLWVSSSGPSDGIQTLVIEDLKTGIVYPLISDRFVIGSEPGVDLLVEDGPAVAATLMLYEKQEIWLGVDAVAIPVEVERPFEVAGRQFRIRVSSDVHIPTEISSVFKYPYRLSVQFTGAVPCARIEDVHRGKSVDITAENRISLIYVLAMELQRDRQANIHSSAEGWCTDDEIGVQVWGRQWHDQTSNNLHVILHRLRKQLKSAGLDPWCIEKKRGKMRLRIQDIIIL